ncbi:cytochrome P450 [Cercophora newfieldiana]|uniref:Cytochrome P450 n=1 Tax=Cercophora newfieldiana TaxID=92897 RepID=A0AA40CSU4_9PEZI|nr:cytochrome P450 [Cercophora newfieldiana]
MATLQGLSFPSLQAWSSVISFQNAFLTISTIGVLTALVSFFHKGKQDGIPELRGTIPYLSSTLLYMTDMRTFLDRARDMLRTSRIMSLKLGPETLYIIKGAENVATMFKTTTTRTSPVGQRRFILRIQKYLWGAVPADYAKFLNDTSGRAKVPLPGTENTPESKRYWRILNDKLHDYFAISSETNALVAVYQRELSKRLEQDFPTTEWTTIMVYAFLQKYMASAATTTLLGPRILTVNPDFHNVLWTFDRFVASLVWGLPKWLTPRAWKTRDRLHAAVHRYLYPAVGEFAWDSDSATADWEPVFGSRVNREVIRWMREDGFAPQTIAGAISILFIFGVNGNTTPVAGWMLMETIQRPELLDRIREEVMGTYVTDPKTGERLIDVQKLLALPLLQSVYTESMRLHVSMNVTREVVGPMSLEGHKLEIGALLQAPTEISHREESVWGVPGHPASEFWAERHIKYVERVDEKDGTVKLEPQFDMTGRQNDFFPYGGGAPVCPGRFFARQEMMLSLAILVSRFDIEFVEWTHMDGSPSERPAENNVEWAGGASVPPDRDMKIRWKRRW